MNGGEIRVHIFHIQSMFNLLFHCNDRSFKQEVLTGLAAGRRESCYMIARRLMLITRGRASISRTLPWDCPTVPAPIIIPRPTTSSHSGIPSKVEKVFRRLSLFPAAVSWLANPTRLASFHRSQLPIVWTWHGKEMVWQTLSSKSDYPIEDCQLKLTNGYTLDSKTGNKQ